MADGRPAPTLVTPQLAPDVELLGPYRDSGLQTPPYLVRRGGRILQVSRLLHTVAAGADGTRTFDEMAAVASAELDRSLSGDDVRALVEKKLGPAGILTIDGDAPAVQPPTGPAPDTRLLALRFRRAVASAEAMSAGARRFVPLFRPPVVTAILAGVLALDFWVFGVVGVGGAAEHLARTPALMLFVMAAVLLSGVFHEIGHATGSVASGGRAGAAGIGLYICWPVLYTNVTDTYRLDRRGRLRTDLGGIYFNAVFILMLGGTYLLTGWEPLLAVILIEHVLVLQQLMPFLRFDGYYIVSDLTGVPDILSRVRPALLSLVPGRPAHPAVLALRPQARRILYCYLVSLVVFLSVAVVPALPLLPRTLGASWQAFGAHVSAMGDAAGRWDAVMVFVHAVGAALLALPLMGLGLTARFVLQRLVQTVRLRRSPAVSVRDWLESSGLAVLEGGTVPGGGMVDYFGFGLEGELVLFGSAPERLAAAAGQLASFDSEKLDRLLIEGPPFAEVVAGVARRNRCNWDERRFRSRLDDTLARRDFRLVVLIPRRDGRLTWRESSQN